MSNFYGSSFIFDDIPSENYGLFIINFESNTYQGSGGADIEIFKQEIYRRSKPYLFGVSQKPVLSFSFTFGSEEPLTAESRSLIESWLFGQLGYKKLRIVQDDLANVYFNCFLVSPKPIYVGNVNYAYECTVVCDSPWAWEYPQKITFTYPTGIANEYYTLYNGSADNDYLYPLINFTISPVGANFQITNYSDNSRFFSFQGLTAGTSVEVNNDLKIVKDVTFGDYIISKFNKNWFRLVPGNNDLLIAGGPSYVAIEYSFARKVGG